MADKVKFQPHAKINLGLIIKGKRPDGYHLLETLMYPIDLHDELEITRTSGDSCHIQLAGIGIDAHAEDNLCWKAWNLLRADFPQVKGIHIYLKKGIPSGAGMGGGSSDAAFTLKGLNEIFGLNLRTDQLARYATQLGADCPFFLYDTPMLASGIGTDLSPFPISLPYEIRWVTSDLHSSTPQAYGGLDWSELNTETSLRDILALPISEWKEKLRNDLEGPVFRMYPQLRETKEQLYREGAVYAAMSGSGSSVFGLFPNG